MSFRIDFAEKERKQLITVYINKPKKSNFSIYDIFLSDKIRYNII